MNVQIEQSPIHGRGVFASHEVIPKGWWQWVYGEIHPLEPGHPALRYAFMWDDECEQVYIPFAPWCYLNHSETPNCEIEDYQGQLTITALRDIKPGEELTIDYSYDPSQE